MVFDFCGRGANLGRLGLADLGWLGFAEGWLSAIEVVVWSMPLSLARSLRVKRPVLASA